MIKIIRKTIRHTVIMMYCSFLITLIVCGIFGEFISNDGYAIQEYFAILVLFFRNSFSFDFYFLQFTYHSYGGKNK